MGAKDALRIASVAAVVTWVGLTGLVPEAWAQARTSPAGQSSSNERVLRTLGGTTRFSTPVRTTAALRKMADANRRDISRLLDEAGLSSISSQVLDALTSGAVTETTVASGERLEWMALRRKGVADIIRNVRWGGAKPFEAYRFSIETPTAVYRFIVPKACANLSLVGTDAKAPAPAPAPPPPPKPTPPPPPPPAPAPTPAPPPPPPPPPVVAPVVQPPAVVLVDRLDPFVMGAFGKQRRTLEDDDVVGGVGSFCDPLIGFKGGVQFQLKPHFMLAPAVGVAFNLDEGGRSSLFADLELNYTFDNGGYVGTGFGIWDFNHGDNVTANLLLQFGAPIARYSDNRAKMLFVVESRLFFDEFSEIDNNYQFWAGLRFVFR